ncbi:hypothetical protein ACLOAV_008333 [Pseudogymnoascus australis]
MQHNLPTLLAIIHRLESKLKCLTDHHRQCARGCHFTPSPDVEEFSPPDVEESPPYNAEGSSSPDVEESPPPDVEESSSPDVEDWTIPYKPEEYFSVRPTARVSSRSPNARKQTVCRWQSAADDLIGTITSMKEFMALRYSKETGDSLIRAILGGVSVPESSSRSVFSQSPLEALKNYARITKGSEYVAKFAAAVHAFQELILVSACEVLVFAGYKEDSVNDAMRMCLTDSQDSHLRRLRMGARWVAEQISALDVEWGDSMTEHIFCSAMSISKYGVLAASTTKSTPFVLQALRRPKISAEETPEPVKDSTYFFRLSIPAFVQVLLGDNVSLETICEALPFGDSYNSQKTKTLCDQYTAIHDASHKEVLLPTPKSQKRKSPEKPAPNNISERHRRAVFDGSPIQSSPASVESPIDTCLNAHDKEGVADNSDCTILRTSAHTHRLPLEACSYVASKKRRLNHLQRVVNDEVDCRNDEPAIAVGSVSNQGSNQFGVATSDKHKTSSIYGGTTIRSNTDETFAVQMILNAAGHIEEESNVASQSQIPIGSTSSEHFMQYVATDQIARNLCKNLHPYPKSQI